MDRDAEIEHLRARIAELESIVENSPDVIARFDRELRHVYVNRAVEAASGMTVADFRGRTHAELGMPDELVEPWRKVYREVFDTGVEGVKDFTFPGPHGPRSYVSRVVPERGPDGEVRTILSVARDVTEWKLADERRMETERRLQQASKLESLGLLAGGIAHDFNNLLTGILAGASLLTARETTPELARFVGQRVEQSAMRAAELCRQLLAYAGHAPIADREIELGELCASTMGLVSAALPRNVRVSLGRHDGAHVLVGDGVQIQQVVMNLLINAAEAIGERGGVVQVTTRLVAASEIPTTGAIVGPKAPTGTLVHLQVTDDGRGMSEATLARIFEPFFTTHFHGRGLGLAAVLGTVRTHGGFLFVRSAEGRGTTFDLYFPAHPRSASADPSAATKPLRAFTGTRLLIVDDEPSILELTSMLARSVGIEPTTATSGRAALERLVAEPDVNLVLLDLTMPDLDGIATLALIREARPELPVVLMSGFAEADALAAATQHRTAGFLQKPFGLPQLVDVLAAASR